MKSQFGRAALHIAAGNDQAEVARILLAYDSDVDDISGMGQTPLMMAAEKGNTSILEVLIENKASVHLKQ